MSEKQQQVDMTPGIVSWNELSTSDPAESREFYSKLFGWCVEEMAMPNETYCFLKLGERPVGGMVQTPPEDEDAPATWMPYVTVANLKDAVAKATSLGAKICRDITPVPKMGSFAVITDPQGAALGLWEFAEKG